MSTPIDSETLRLEVLAEVQQLSQDRGMSAEHGEGYWLDTWGPDASIVRWIQGGVDEPVAKIEFDTVRLLVLERAASAHTELADALERVGYTVHVVAGFVQPICSTCGGAGYRVAEYGYTVTGSGFGDVSPKEHDVPCDACNGKGEF